MKSQTPELTGLLPFLFCLMTDRTVGPGGESFLEIWNNSNASVMLQYGQFLA